MTSDPHELPPSPLHGGIGSYINAGGKVGVLVELACESEFVSRTEEFSQLMHDIAMQIAASDPKFIRKEDITPEAYEREKDICRAIAVSKPAYIVDKLFEERMAKFYEEVLSLRATLYKDQTMTVSQFIATKIAKLAENISVRRFVRFKVGDTSRELEGGDEAGIAVKKPKGPRLGSGSAAVKPDAE